MAEKRTPSLPRWDRPIRIPERVQVEHADPEFALAGEKSTWRLPFSLAEGVAPGAMLRLQLFGGRNNKIEFEHPQADRPGGDGYVTAHTADGTALKVEAGRPAGTFVVALGERGLGAGGALIVTIGDRSSGGGGIRASTVSALNKFFVLYRPEAQEGAKRAGGQGSTWTERNRHLIVGACTMHILGGAIHHLRAYVPSQTRPGEPLDVLVRPEDEFGNLSHETLGEIGVFLGDEELQASVVRPGESTCVRARVALPEEGVHRVKIIDRRSGGEALTNPMICSAAGGEREVLWGMIHGHTEMSDGSGTLEYYFRQMREEAGLDFAASGDHDHLWETSDELWELTCRTVAEQNRPGEFVVFLGYEWAKWRRNGDGDRNVYYLKDRRPMYRSDEGEHPRPPDLFAALAGEEAIVIPHHTAHGGNFCDWKDHDPEKERLVEIFQFRGSYECAPEEGNPVPEGGGPGTLEPFPAGYVRNALAAGWRVGFTGGGDDHWGHSGTDYPLAFGDRNYRSGLTAVLAAARTREAIFEAMRDRRVVATTGPRILLNYTLSGSPMGSELDAARHPDLARRRGLRVEFHGTSPADRIEIIRNNNVVHAFGGGELDCELAWEDAAPLGEVLLRGTKFRRRPFCFYYVRVVQQDGEVAWASPVWIDA